MIYMYNIQCVRNKTGTFLVDVSRVCALNLHDLLDGYSK